VKSLLQDVFFVVEEVVIVDMLLGGLLVTRREQGNLSCRGGRIEVRDAGRL
jgi:hypothetical protein